MTDIPFLSVHPRTGRTVPSAQLLEFLRDWCARHASYSGADANMMESFLRNSEITNARYYVNAGFTRMLAAAQEWRDSLDASALRHIEEMSAGFQDYPQ